MSDFLDLEMDAPSALKAPFMPATAPKVSPAPAPAPSPLTTGRALLVAATTLEGLTEAAHNVAGACVAAGLKDMNHPTRVQLRSVYHAVRAAIVWVQLWAWLGSVTVRAKLEQDARPATPEPTGLGLTSALAGIATEGAVNASTQGAGSLAAGTMRGVGYRDAAGYLRALSLGVKAATAEEYKRILQSRYGYSDAAISELHVTLITESDRPVGAGIHHDYRVDGKTEHDLRREAAVAAAKLVRETADATTLALAQRLTVADSADAWWEIGWRGVGSITRAELVAATGDEKLAPEPKISSTQLARTIDSLRGTHDATMVATRPRGVKVRWQIGRGQQHAAFVGAEYGKVLAIVDLGTDNSLTFDGDQTIADEVRAEYSRLCGDEVLRPGDVTAWLNQLLRKSYGAVRSGDRYLLAPQHKDAARALVTKIAAVWSTGNWVLGRIVDGVPELGVTYQDVATVIGGIWQGLANEVAEAEERWTKTVEDATAKAQKPGVRACANELERIDGAKVGEGLQARLGQLAIIGEGPLAPLRARVVALRAKVSAALVEANDPTSERFAQMDLS